MREVSGGRFYECCQYRRGHVGLYGSGSADCTREKDHFAGEQLRIAAGLLVLVGIMLGWRVHPIFFALSAFVGAGLVFAGITDTCGMGLLLARMPWNRVKDAPRSTCSPKDGNACT